FTGKRGQYISVIAPDSVKCTRIILAGIGKPKELDHKALENLGGGLVPHLNGAGVKSATVFLEEIKGLDISLPEAAARIGHGASLRSYSFDKYYTKKTADEKPSMEALTVAVADSKACAKFYSDLEKLADGIFLTRDLV